MKRAILLLSGMLWGDHPVRHTQSGADGRHNDWLLKVGPDFQANVKPPPWGGR